MAVDSITLARPYADAAFRRAQETGQVERWSRMLTLLAGIAKDGAVQVLLANPKVSDALLVELFREVAGDQLIQEGKNFLGVRNWDNMCSSSNWKAISFSVQRTHCWTRSGSGWQTQPSRRSVISSLTFAA